MSDRILVIRFGALGDVLLTSPAVLNLRLSFLNHKIVYLTKERYRAVVAGFDGVDEIVTIPDEASAAQYLGSLVRLRRFDWHAVIDLHGKPRSWLARHLVGADRQVVYPKRRRERLALTRRNKTIPESWPHTIDLYNQAVTVLGGKVVARRPILTPPNLSEVEIDPPMDLARPVVVIAPGAAHPTKQFPFERFTEIARVLIETHNARIWWAVTNADRRAWPIESHIPKDSLTLLVDRTFPELAAIISRAALTIANDSGIAHLSSAVGTPVMTMFGPTHPALGFAPQGLLDKVIEVGEFCRPCSRHGKSSCWRDSRHCFDRIAIDDVVRQAGTLLKLRANAAPAMLVDRDGTLIVDKHYLSDPDQIEFIPAGVESLKEAQARGYKVVVLSNQSGVARGFFDENTVRRVNGRLAQMLAEAGLQIGGIYYCPHYEQGEVPEYSIACDCRKPRPGLAERAARELNLDLRRSVVIGDKRDDLALARGLGARGIMVRTGHGEEQANGLPSSAIGSTEIVDDLAAAVNAVLTGAPK